MANNDSPDQEMERLLREHLASEAANFPESGDPWEWLESRLGEQSNPSRLSSLRDRIFPQGERRWTPALATVAVAAIAVVAAASVWVATGGDGEGPGLEMASLGAESATTLPSATAAPAAASLPASEAPLSTTAPRAESTRALPVPTTAQAREQARSTPALPAESRPTALPAATAAPPAAAAPAPAVGVTPAMPLPTRAGPAPAATAVPAPTSAPAAAQTATPAPAWMSPEAAAMAESAPGAKSDGYTGRGKPAPESAPPPATNFRDYPRQDFVETLDDAVSTFSLDTDRTSFQLALNWARSGYQVDPASVRAEEWVNAFDYQYTLPNRDRFAITADVLPHPLDRDKHLARLAFQAPEIVDNVPLNVTLVLDASGSMSSGNRVAIAREAADSIRKSLDSQDRIAVVHFTNDVIRRFTVEHERPSDEDVKWSISQLAPRGSTNVQAGLDLGVRLANEARRDRPEAHNYIILMSDGVANVDATNPFAILESAYDPDRGNPLRIITVGVGIENYNDYLLEQIAQYGNGWYRYLSDTAQARTTFSRENWIALSTPFADQTRAQVTWNPDLVESWRIIGYENRVTSDESFTEDRKEFAEIPSGAATTVFYELELREGGWDQDSSAAGRLAGIELRWVMPGNGMSVSQQSEFWAERPSLPFTSWTSGDPLLAFGAVVALAADRYSATDYGYRSQWEDFDILREATEYLGLPLGGLQSYQDFAFLLKHVMRDMQARPGPDDSSGYSR